jgi:hypothetical protein
LDVGGRRPLICTGFGAVAHECAQCLKHRLVILLRGVHHALQGVDAAKPHDNLVAAQLLKAFETCWLMT